MHPNTDQFIGPNAASIGDPLVTADDCHSDRIGIILYPLEGYSFAAPRPWKITLHPRRQETERKKCRKIENRRLILKLKAEGSPPVNPKLVSKSEAARQLNMSRTTLLKIMQEDRDSGVTPPRFVEVETTLGVFRLRQHDVAVFGASLQTFCAKPHRAIASQQKMACRS